MVKENVSMVRIICSLRVREASGNRGVAEVNVQNLMFDLGQCKRFPVAMLC